MQMMEEALLGLQEKTRKTIIRRCLVCLDLFVCHFVINQNQ